jgi:translation initiation factor IF-3
MTYERHSTWVAKPEVHAEVQLPRKPLQTYSCKRRLELLNRIKDDLSDVAQVDQEPSLEGRQLLMVLSKVKKK